MNNLMRGIPQCWVITKWLDRQVSLYKMVQKVFHSSGISSEHQWKTDTTYLQWPRITPHGRNTPIGIIPQHTPILPSCTYNPQTATLGCWDIWPTRKHIFEAM